MRTRTHSLRPGRLVPPRHSTTATLQHNNHVPPPSARRIDQFCSCHHRELIWCECKRTLERLPPSDCAPPRARMSHRAAISAPTSGSFLSPLTQSPFTPDPRGTNPPLHPSCLLSKYLLGTPDTSLRGLSTLNALRALTSKPAAFPPMGVAPSPLVACSRIALNNLNKRI